MFKIIMECQGEKDIVHNRVLRTKPGIQVHHLCYFIIGQYSVLWPWSYLGGMSNAVDLCVMEEKEKEKKKTDISK